MSITHVLCPIDGTDPSAVALPTAAAVARRLDVPLRIFSGVEDRHEAAARRSVITLQVDEVIPDAPSPTIEVTVAPHVPPAIVAFAGDDALVVMATTTRPHLAAGYLGSATEHVIRNLHRPVMTVGPSADVSVDALQGVVVPCDGSTLSERALESGRTWADHLGVPMTVVSVLDEGRSGDPGESNYVRNLATSYDASWEVLHGDDIAKVLASWAGPRLIVMTTHGRSGWSRFRYGSVATATTRWASGPVIKVCPLDDAVAEAPAAAMSDLDYPAGVP